MEQLIPLNIREAMISRGRLIEVAMLKKKVVIPLTRSQFETFDRLILLYLTSTRLVNLIDKANYFIIQMVYEKKIRPAHLNLKTKFRFNFNVAESSAIYTMLFRLIISSESAYETTLRNFICSEIDFQTA